MTLNEFKTLPNDYIGDGAYICDTGYSFIIITTDCISIQNEIHIDMHSLKAINNFVKHKR